MKTSAEDKNKKFRTSKTSIRTLFIAVFLLIQIAVFITLVIVAYVYDVAWLNVLYVIAEVISIICAIPIINSRMDPSYKVAWLTFMVINPILGALFYLLFANKKFSKKEKNQNAPMLKSLNAALNSSESNGQSYRLRPERDGEIYNLAHYIRRYSFTDTYKNTRTSYYPWGEKAFPVMLEKLKSAKHYIFMEYFIIDPGKFWDSILEVLLQKVKEGVEVRL
ncbi:MAG: PLDc N-terminal domain-containing protein, partial [Bacilli bacterium]|nr:PLDc N-terminal domain-containing protein [Bacilli bacterium]